MRSLSFPSPVNWLAADAAGGSGGRSDQLRRKTLAVVSLIMVAAGLLGLLGSFLALSNGMFAPFIAATLTLAGAMASIVLQRSRLYEAATAVQFSAILGVGAIFAIAVPEIVDFGLATVLLAPIHASLLAGPRQKKAAWMAAAAIVVLASAANAGWIIMFHESGGIQWLGASGFLMGAIVVGYAAHRVNTAFEVYEKTQINAYRHLVEHVRDSVMRFGTDGEVLFVSNSSEKLFGCERFVLSASGIVERLHVLDRPVYMTAFDDTNARGLARTIEVRLKRDDDAGASRFVWVEAAFSPVKGEGGDGGRYEVVALLRDISQRKSIENDMREARRSAEEASNAKSRFLATVGHELRTPLNAIVGFSEMMSEGIAGELSDGNREYAGIIHQSGQHLLDIVNMLLDMSKIEAGKFELQTEPVTPDSLIEPSLRIVDSLARSRNVTLKTELAPSLPQITCDERACRQILINLLSNAIKFSNEGGEVSVKMKQLGQYLSIAIADKGIGMPAEVLDRVGEPFFQAQGGLARHYEGTGLGLSIVKGLVELHDGTLHAQSETGKGTTMFVLLPINGPATKSIHNEVVTALPRETTTKTLPSWQDPKSIAL